MLETIKKIWLRVRGWLLAFLVVGGIVVLFHNHLNVFRDYDEDAIIVTVVRVEMRVIGNDTTDIWGDNHAVPVMITKERFTMPDGRIYQSFVVPYERRYTGGNVFIKLYCFPSYWGTFQAKVSLQMDNLFDYGMPVLYDTYEIINPPPPPRL